MSAPPAGLSSLPFPPALLALDVVGAALLGLGAAEHFGNVALLTAWTGCADAALIAMALGAVAMIVAAAGIVSALLARARSRASARP